MRIDSDQAMMKALLSHRRVKDTTDGEERWLDQDGNVANAKGPTHYPDPADGWELVPQTETRYTVITVNQTSGSYTLLGTLHLTKEAAQKRLARDGGLSVATVVFDVP